MANDRLYSTIPTEATEAEVLVYGTRDIGGGYVSVGVPALIIPPTLYYPNSTDCAAWYGNYDAVPGPSKAVWQDNAYNGTQLNTVSTDDANGITATYTIQEEEPFGFTGPGHIFQLRISSNPTQYDILGRLYDADGGVGSALYIWDNNSGVWSQIDTHSGGAPGVVTLEATISTDPSYYLDGSNDVYLLMANVDFGPYTCIARYLEMTVTY